MERGEELPENIKREERNRARGSHVEGFDEEGSISDDALAVFLGRGCSNPSLSTGFMRRAAAAAALSAAAAVSAASESAASAAAAAVAAAAVDAAAADVAAAIVAA